MQNLIKELFTIHSEAFISGFFLLISVLIPLIASKLFSFNILSFFKKYIRKTRFSNHLQKVSEIYKSLEVISKLESVERVILFCGHNCGGLPVFNKPFWVSVITTLSKVNTDTFLYNDKVLVDKDYIDLLLKTITEEKVHIEVENMPSCFLKKIYQNEEIIHSYVYYIGVIDNQLIYMSCSSKTKDLLKKDLDLIDLHINKIKSHI
jgi:hypothetical protein